MADLTDAQWEYLRLFVKWEQEQRQRPEGRGGRWSDGRRVLNGVLWILRTGAPWPGSAAAVRSVLDLPPAFPAMGAVGGAGGHFMGALRSRAGPRRTRAGRELGRRLVHRGKKGGDRIGPTRCGKGSKIMAIADCHGLPVAVGVTSASPNESTLVEDTLRQRHVSALPKRRIGDRAYDSDRLDERLRREHGIEMIAPNRRRRKRTQDGRRLRRYLRRWKVERLFAWLKNFRRISSPWERHAANFLGMVQLGCVLILLRHL